MFLDYFVLSYLFILFNHVYVLFDALIKNLCAGVSVFASKTPLKQTYRASQRNDSPKLFFFFQCKLKLTTHI